MEKEPDDPKNHSPQDGDEFSKPDEGNHGCHEKNQAEQPFGG